MEKKCCKCSILKPLSDYYKEGGACKICTCARRREMWANRSPEKIQKDREYDIPYGKKYVEKNKELIIQKRIEYNARPEIKKRRAEYFQNNKEKRKIWIKKYYYKNHEKFLEYHKNYRIKNKDHIDKYTKEYYQQPHVKEKMKLKGRKVVESLTDSYVRSMIIGKSPLTAKDIPQSLVEVKRLQLQIKRMAENEKR